MSKPTQEQQELKEYSDEVQKLYLQFMITHSTAFVRCQNIINPTYWTDRLRPACRYIVKYAEDYQTLPTTEQIEAETGVNVPKLPAVGDEHIKWFLENIEEFCRHKAMEALVYEGPALIAKGAYSELERRSKENMMISLQKDLGTDYFANPLERLHRMRDRSNMMSTGWKSIDYKLNGGFNRGELSFFAGGPGSGKSLFLQNLALNWVQMGLNVVYITLELAEDLVGLRFDAMITEMSTKQIWRNMDDVALRLGIIPKQSSVKWGKLQIKKLPEGGTNANDIRAYLKEFEIQQGVKPDAIVIDYLDLLYPNNRRINASDQFIKDKYTSEELRGVASEWNIYACTASQLNRAAAQESDFDVSHIAGGISKINTADNVMAIFTTANMKERGEYQIQFLKTRSSSGVGSRVTLQFNAESLRIVDAPEDEDYAGNQTMSQALQNKVQGLTIKPPAHVELKAPTAPTLMIPKSTTTVSTRVQETPNQIADRAAKLRSLANKLND
jgi:KaiC/GvpD/RAD55 family RecA-like ATPase